MVNVKIARQFRNSIKKEVLSAAAEQVMKIQNPGADLEVTIVIDDDEAIHQLNKNYLGQDSPTDVLSFTAHEMDPETGRTYLGDIIISLPRAQEQAEIANHPLTVEVSLLVVHGMLHLFGFDHDTDEGKNLMWVEQSRILGQLGVEVKQLPES